MRDKPSWLAQLAVCAVVSLGVSLMAYVATPLFAAWENSLLDTHLRHTPAGEAGQKIALILGGDRSMIEIEGWPWPRGVHGRLIEERLSAARVIAYDVFLVDPTTDEQDTALAGAIAGHGGVVLGSAYREDGLLLRPLDIFADHAATGFFNFYPDSDYVVRRYTLAKRVGHGQYTELTPSFILAVMEAAGLDPLIDPAGDLRLVGNDRAIALDDLSAFKLPVAADAYPIYEFADVLAGRVPAEAFEDAIVFVGISATGASDNVHTATGYLPGTRALADICYALLSGYMPRRAPALMQMAFVFGAAFVCLAATSRLSERLNWLPTVLSVPAVILIAHLAFRYGGLYLAAAPGAFTLALAGILYLFYLRVVRESEQRQTMLMNMIACLVSAIDAKDPVTAGHSQRVSEVSVRIAEKKGLGRRDIANIRFAGLIHDIGKIGVSDAVLNKPGKYTPEEYAEMRRHPERGTTIMAPAGLPPEVMAGILDHHERPDGKGYPNGKTAGALHLFAEIIKIADVYDALSSKRQYKEAWPIERVCDVMYAGRGSEFNAELVDLFLEDIRPEGWSPTPAGTED